MDSDVYRIINSFWGEEEIMVWIGICDDEEFHRRQIIKHCEYYFESVRQEHCYIEFSSGEEVLAYHGDRLLILFMDIEMGEVSGLGVLEKLRESDLVWRFAFVSNHQEQRLDTIDIKTLAFIEKPIQYAAVEKCMNIAIREHEKNILATFTVFDGKNCVEISDIIYIQADRYYVSIHAKNKSFVGYDGIGQCEEQLQGTSMVRVHKSYLINMQHVHKLSAGEVVMEDGLRLPVGRKYSINVREKYHNFLKSVTVERNDMQF